MNTVMCKLCMTILDKYSNDFEVLGEIVKEMLEVVVLKVNFKEEENHVICNTCKENLDQSFEFKSICIFTEGCIYPYVHCSDNREVNLKAIYVREKTVESCFKFEENDEVCRFCLSLTKSNTALKSEILQYDQFFGKLMPELDLKAISKVFVCQRCHLSIGKYAKFVKFCLDNQPKIIENDQKCTDHDNENKTNFTHPVESCNKETEKELPLKLYSLPLQTEQDVNANKNRSIPIKEPAEFLFDENENYSLPNLKLENADHFIKMEDIEIKSDEGSKCDSLDGNIWQKENICQIVPEQMENVSVAQDETRRTNHLKAHVLTHRDVSEVKMFKCELCAFQTEAKYRLKRHLLIHKDLSETKKFKCENCTYESSRKGLLKSHMFIHKNVSEIDIFKCEICAYKAKRKADLNRHMLVHKDLSETEIFKCKICAYVSNRKGNLIRHMLIHADVSEIKKFKCKICDYEAKERRRLIHHMLIHQDLSEIDMFKCANCNYESRRKSSVKSHMVIHKEVFEIFKCKMCDYETRRQGNLYSHMLIHKDVSEIETFKCKICAYEGKRKSNLNSHMKIHN